MVAQNALSLFHIAMYSWIDKMLSRPAWAAPQLEEIPAMNPGARQGSCRLGHAAWC
jgi:hypothetical protein